jgi:hypothetical protein
MMSTDLQHNFGKAETVLLTGCSAGGLATYLHTDYVHTLMPSGVTKYGASAISGFFLLHPTVEKKPVYPTQVRKTPHVPARGWASFSLLWLYSHWHARANLHFLGQPDSFLAADEVHLRHRQLHGRRQRGLHRRQGSRRRYKSFEHHPAYFLSDSL